MSEKKKMNSAKSYVSALMMSTVLAGGALVLSPITMPQVSLAHAQSSQTLISAVLFNGSARLKPAVLAGVVESNTGAVLNDAVIQSDIEAIKAAYKRKGRNAASVTARIISLPSGRVNVVFDIDEGDKSKIAAINFSGNEAFGASRLKDVVTTHKTNLLSWLRADDLYDPKRIENDERLLAQFYVNNGYADFQVLSTDVTFDDAENAYTVTFNVEEGARYTFGDINIETSIPGVDTESLKGLLYSDAGDKYNARNIEKSVTAIAEKLSGEGYAFAEVSPRGDRNFQDNTISLTYYVDEGARSYIDRIEIQGNTRTRDYVIRREFDMSEGDAYNTALVKSAKRRLEALGFFKTVKVTTRPGSSADRVILVVDVEDQPTGDLSLGGGYSSTGGPLAEVSFSEKNFLGRGQYLKVSGSFGQDDRKYQLSFTEPYFLGRRLAAGFDAYRTESTSSADLETDSTGVTLRLGAPITDNLSVLGYYSFDRSTISVSDDDLATLSVAMESSLGTWTKSAVGANITYDTLDNKKLPREGIYAKMNLEYAGVGGDINYIKTTGRVTGYHTLLEGADVVGMLAAGAGHIQSTSGELRNFENFFQGTSEIRGFKSSGFGPRDLSTGDALGGTTYYNATAELQFPLYGLPRSLGLRGAVFVEAGTLYGNEYSGGALTAASKATFDDTTIRASVGASIIWDSPFGPLRANYAHAFSKKSYDEIQEFNFGISTKF